LKDNGDMVTCK